MAQEKFSNSLQNDIWAIVRQISLNPNAEISESTDLFESGTLDSVVLVGLLTKLEERFQLEIPPTEFSPDNFSTVGGMSRLIHRLKAK